MAAFQLPDTVDAALAFLAQNAATVAAGCTDLFPATQNRSLTGPVLDITAISALRGISQDDKFIRIGAATRWSDIIQTDLPPAFDMLKQAAHEVGSVQIQNAGTIAGNICNASPAADGVPCLLALDAEVEIASSDETRRIPLQNFITGPRQTALRSNEMVTAIFVPLRACAGHSHFVKLGARKYLVISIAMAAARLETLNGRVKTAAISVGACSAVARRLPAIEAALIGKPADATLEGQVTEKRVAPFLSPIGDMRADAAYRTTAAVELVRQCLCAVTNKAQEPVS